MTEFIHIKNILLTKFQKEAQKIIIEVCYENIQEPKYCSFYKAILEKERGGEWTVRAVTVYDWNKDRFLSVGTLYAPILYEEIKNKIVYSLCQNPEFELEIAL